MSPPRHYLAFIAVGIVALFCFAQYAFQDLHRPGWGLPANPAPGLVRPDLGRYKHIRTLSSDEFPTNSPNRRVILIGDVHGMVKPFHKLLKKAAYNDRHDVLVHTGDILTKGHHAGSMQIIKYMTTHNITGVRGNHDQEIIEWKGWINWVESLPGGKKWLSYLEAKWLVAKAKGYTPKEWADHQRRRSTGKDAQWWHTVPKKWTPFGDHYRVARELTEEQYAYLTSLPLKLHIPSAHTLIVHAGLLPCDVRYSYDDDRHQPLARIPLILNYTASLDDEGIQVLRHLQEAALLREVPQNTDPWANLNLRSILKNKELSRRANEGKPWAMYWNHQMSMCSGFNEEPDLSQPDPKRQHGPDLSRKGKSLPCYPSSVIYGHAASRGLDLDRWTFGLDSGCVYNRQLSAMILGPNSSLDKRWDWDEGDEEEEESDDVSLDVSEEHHNKEEDVASESNLGGGHPRKNGARVIRFGEHAKATIVYVNCSR